MLLVYFSSATENTKRFVEKVGLPSARIPLYKHEPELVVDEPYVLICPTYGGGVSLTHENSRPVPRQVIRFLNDERNRGLIRGVIASGNSNFGADYCRAGEVIAAKCKVPYLYRFELMGAPEDVNHVRLELIAQAERLGLAPLEHVPPNITDDPNAERLARLRAKYTGKYSRSRTTKVSH